MPPSYTAACMVASPQSCLFLASPSCMVEYYQPAWLLVASSLPRGGPAPFSLPAHILNADWELPTGPHIWPRLQWTTFSSSPVSFYLLSAAIFSQGKSTQWKGDSTSLPLTQVLYKSPPRPCHQLLQILKVHVPLAWSIAGLLTCHCYVKCLNCHISPFLQSWALGKFLRDPSLHPITRSHEGE